MKDSLIENTVTYSIVAVLLAMTLALVTVGFSFALEESYPNWPTSPGERELPAIAILATVVAMDSLLIATFKQAWRRGTILCAMFALAINITAFLLELNAS